MKNTIIVLLVLTVGILGVLLYTRNDTNKDGDNSSGSVQSSNTQNSDSNVTSGVTIDLSNQGLDKIPTNILDNPKATTLDVSNNNLTGSLPSEIRKLTNLEVLNASNNKMTGIPAEIGQLSKLLIINYANNDISGLPLEIGNLKNLETLDLRGNPKVSKYDISLIQPKIPSAVILVD